MSSKNRHAVNMVVTQLFLGCLLICVTVAVHAVILDYLFRALDHVATYTHRFTRKSWKMIVLIFTVLVVFAAHIIQIWIWALFYLQINAWQTLEEALYFSTSTFTTVGYGDLILGERWRLISSFQSANGFILFGWSTAFIFEVMSKLYKRETISHKD